MEPQVVTIDNRPLVIFYCLSQPFIYTTPVMLILSKSPQGIADALGYLYNHL